VVLVSFVPVRLKKQKVSGVQTGVRREAGRVAERGVSEQRIK
jgi:hypothetical protein